MTARIWLVALAVVLLATRASAQTTVTTCGQEVKGFASLAADLDCTGFQGGPNVTLHGGKLSLGGHTLTGGTIGVYCDGNCKIEGPGTITGSALIGIIAFGVPLKLTQVDVTNHAQMGIECWESCGILGPATISGNGTGIRSGGTTRLRSVTLTGNQTGILAANNGARARALLFDSTVSANEVGVVADLLVKSTNTAVTGNSRIGISAGAAGCPRRAHASLKGGTATGNGTDPGCGTTLACADVATCGSAPHLAGGATCDHSYANGSGIPGTDWDVCALD